jgi:hypothetical protein
MGVCVGPIHVSALPCGPSVRLVECCVHGFQLSLARGPWSVLWQGGCPFPLLILSPLSLLHLSFPLPTFPFSSHTSGGHRTLSLWIARTSCPLSPFQDHPACPVEFHERFGIRIGSVGSIHSVHCMSRNWCRRLALSGGESPSAVDDSI